MILDFQPRKRTFTLTGSGIDPKEMMRDFGLDFFPGRGGVFTTDCAYAAAPFHKDATPRALAEMQTIVDAWTDSWRPESGAHIRCPADQELWAFQKATTEYLLRRGGGLDGDEPGLGKTPTAICFANEISAKKVLVICPANIRRQWEAQIHRWSTMPRYEGIHFTYPIMSTRRGVDVDAQWLIVSYDLARTPVVGGLLASCKFDLLILDEAHALKTSDSGRTRAIFGDYETGKFRKKKTHEVLFDALASRAGAVVALTGTPLLNRPREAYTLSRALCWDSIDFLSEQGFAERFNPIVRREGSRENPETGEIETYQYTDERVGRFEELQYRMRSHFMARHAKREVMTQLDMPSYNIIEVDDSGPVRQALQAESLLGIDPDTFDPDNIKILGHIAEVRHQMGMAIAPQVADYVDMLIEGGETKIVVFGWHHDTIDLLMQRLHLHGCVHIDGRVGSSDERERRKVRFLKDPRCQILIGNMVSLGVGTDGLQEVSNHCLIAEPDWVPSNNKQAVDRLDRGGQKRTVQADLFVAPGSILEKILASALRKEHNIHRALDRRR